MPPASPPSSDSRPRAVLGLLLVLALLGTGATAAGAATGLSAGAAAPAGVGPPVVAPLSTTTVLNSTAAATATAATGTVTDAVTAVTDTTDDTAQTVTDTTDDTVAGTVDDATTTVTNGTDGLVDGSTGVSADLEVNAGDGGNETGATGDGDGDTSAGSGQESVPTTTARTEGSAARPGPTGGEPRRGGGLPAAAGGAAVLGVATLAGAALLGRSAGLADGTTVRAGLSAVRGTDPRDWLRWVLWSAGYSRYDDSDPLAHETRAALYRRIGDAPGVYLTALAEEVDVPISTARHHLRVLDAESLVTTGVIRGKRRYFPVSTEHPALQAALADETQAGLLAAIARHDGASVSTLAAEIDRDVSTVSTQLQQLAAADLVDRGRDGRRVWNRLASHVEPYFEGPAGAETD